LSSDNLLKSNALRQNFNLRFDNLTISFSPCDEGERKLIVHQITCEDSKTMGKKS